MEVYPPHLNYSTVQGRDALSPMPFVMALEPLLAAICKTGGVLGGENTVQVVQSGCIRR